MDLLVEDEESDDSDEFGFDKAKEEEKEFEPLFDELKKKIDFENEMKENNDNNGEER